MAGPGESEGANGTGGGSAICGSARRGMAGRGTAGQGESEGANGTGGGSAICGTAGRGKARQGWARRGVAGRGCQWHILFYNVQCFERRTK